MRHINIYFCSWISFVFNKAQHVTESQNNKQVWGGGENPIAL